MARAPHSHRPAVAATLGVLLGCVVLLAARPAAAYTWMLRHGYHGCGTCHADPSGGELLNAYGRAQGDLLLRMRYGGATAQPEVAAPTDFEGFDDFDEGGAKAAPKAAPAAPAPADSGPSPLAGFLWGAFEPPEELLLGGSFRTAALGGPDQDFRWFPMQADVYGQVRIGSFVAAGSVGAARVNAGSPHARKAQVTTGQGDQMNLLSRTHWVGFAPSPEILLRAGRLQLPFGLRIPEHTAWVRDQTLTDRESDQQHGVAFAFHADELRGEVMAIAGNYQVSPDRYRDRGYAGYLELLAADRLAVGLSSAVTRASADASTLEQEVTVRQAHGPMLRWALHPDVALLAEADVLLRSRHDLGYVALAQLDWEPVQGLHFLGTGELLDAGLRSGASPSGARPEPQRGSGKPRVAAGLGVDWFFWHHLELRVDAIWRQPVAQESGITFLGQLHAYL